LRGIFESKKYFASAIKDLFSFIKNGTFGLPAVRIGVKVVGKD
jgi:hypothetical protein